MPRDPNNPIRTPSFRAKLSTMKGLSADEKSLFQRIGNLVDVLSYTQRQGNNPGLARGRKNDPTVPVPQNVNTTATFGGLELTWDPVNFKSSKGRLDGVAFYEVQFSDTTTFSSFNTIESVGTRTVIKSAISSTLFVRLRTVTKRGLVSNFTEISSVNVADSPFLADQDNIAPENRTSVLPHPKLIGASLDNSGGGSIFTGVGATVGPSPFTLDNDFSGFTTIPEFRHDITYNLHERASPFPGFEDKRLETVGEEFIEEDSFYTFDPNFYIRPLILTGSFTDFFEVQSPSFDPAQIDTEFLRGRIINDFYFPDHPQLGIILDATMSTLKF